MKIRMPRIFKLTFALAKSLALALRIQLFIRVDAHLRAHLAVLLLRLRLLGCVLFPVHVFRLLLLERHRAVHGHVPFVPADRARHVCHLVALVVVLRAFEGEVPQSTAQRALLVGLRDAVAVRQRDLQLALLLRLVSRKMN